MITSCYPRCLLLDCSRIHTTRHIDITHICPSHHFVSPICLIHPVEALSTIRTLNASRSDESGSITPHLALALAPKSSLPELAQPPFVQSRISISRSAWPRST